MTYSFPVRRHVSIKLGIGALPMFDVKTSGRPKCGVGGLVMDSEKPIRATPTFVSAVAIDDYGHQLMPLIKSFDEQDMLKNLIYKDPEAEWAEHEKLLVDARQIDGCSGPTDCVGWGTDASAPKAKTITENASYVLRRSAFEHYVDFLLMEEHIKARGGKVTKEQISKEVALWDQWVVWLKSYKAWLAQTLKVKFLKDSDFQTMQQFDVDLQTFRNRYRTLTGLDVSLKYPHPLPTGGLPWKWILITAGAGVIVYGLHELNLLRMPSMPAFLKPGPKEATA